ncbi:ATP-binding protein [Cryptosporangium aurantiacum]|uniref:Predicted ATPase n=1 Tax=Cryptosporangium aurantiacum TaxID=134849 RepID=A0A1M7RB91_9ACTN|nr:AAA family ATPase [Cryptosporangium aurantiacum]SHN43402.1 Predicted ATPase [Cryptosporangium aurantiacum]
MLRCRVLGPLEIERPGTTPARLPRRQRALLTRLLLARGRVVTFDALADCVWGDEDGPADVRGALYTLASRVRAVLGNGLVTHSTGYSLALPSDAVDAWAFEDGLHAARAADGRVALERYERLLADWRGRAFDEFADGFAAAESVRLEELRRCAVAERIDLLIDLGDTASAVAIAEARATAHPLREAAEARWMETPAAAPAPARVPAPPGSFVGRSAELAALADAVEQGRLVTVVGPGGIGKTRLAVEFARARLDAAATHWVDLAAAPDPAATPFVFCDALRLTIPAARDVRTTLVTALARAPATVLVDNCEHVVDAVADLVAELTRACPELTVLATSREPLAIDGEQVVGLGPLPTDGAVELLRRRLRESGDPDPAPDAVLTALSARLDGMPLALELAAARAATLGLAALERSMAAPATRGRPDRHRDLVTVFDWSYRLLGEQEQRLLRRLAVFPDWFSFADVTGVCADDVLPAADIDGRLGALVAKSFVVRRSEVRAGERAYRLLVPVREFADRLLAATHEDERLRQRHAETVVAAAEDAAALLGTPAEPGGWRELAVAAPRLRAVYAWCRDNVRTDLAVRLSAALHRYACVRDDHEMLGWAETARLLPGAAAHPLRGLLCASAATRLMARGEWDAARRLAASGVAESGSDAPIPLIVLGDVEGAFDDGGESTYRRAWTVAREQGDAWGELEAAGNIAINRAHRGDLAERDVWIERCRAVLDRSSSPLLQAIMLYVFGVCHGSVDPASAETYLVRCHQLATRLGAAYVAGAAMTRITRFRSRLADLGRSLEIFETAIDQWRATGNRGELWVTLYRLVPFLVDAGEPETALAVYTAAIGSAELPERHLREHPHVRPVEQARAALGPAAVAGRLEWTGADAERVARAALAAIGRAARTS